MKNRKPRIDIEYRVAIDITCAGIKIEWPTLHTIIYDYLRDILLDEIRPERYIYEAEAQHVTYKRGTIEMAQFLSELKKHQEGKNSKLDQLTPATRLLNR